jgi:hypothetical protein
LQLDESRLRDTLANAGEFQANLLSDGILTFSEYESAVFAAVHCEQDAGLQIIAYPIPGQPGRPGPELTSRGEYQYLPVAPEGSDSAQLHKAFDECERNFDGSVRQLWAEHVAPTEKDMQVARDTISQCLRDHGIKVSEHPSGNELMRVAYPPSGIPSQPQPNEPYLGCATSAAAAFGIPGYLGQ